MSDNDLLTNLVVKQQEINTETAKALGELPTTMKNMNNRLFIDNGGILKTIYETAKSDHVTVCTEVRGIDNRVGKIELTHRDAKKWLAGAIAVISTEGAMLGWYFTHVAGKVSSFLDAVKR